MDTGCAQSHGDIDASAGLMRDLTNLQNQGHLPGGEDPRSRGALEQDQLGQETTKGVQGQWCEVCSVGDLAI